LRLTKGNHVNLFYHLLSEQLDRSLIIDSNRIAFPSIKNEMPSPVPH
jgi:hypothetical protein